MQSAAEPPSPRDKNAERPIAQFLSPPGLRWEEVTITFISDDSIKVEARGHTEKYTFAEIGFKDRRKGDLPDTRWGTLKTIAEHEGEVPWKANLTQEQRHQLKKIVSDLRKRLKALMQIDDDPFEPYRTANAYKTKFKLIAPSR